LTAALGLAALLAWQAQDAARSHRRAAEGVLRDSARLAGREFLRRVCNEVDYFGFYPVIYMLSANERASPGSDLPTPEDLSRLARRVGRAPLPARAFFRVDLLTGEVFSSPGAPADLSLWARESLPALLAARAAPLGELAAESLVVAGRPRTIVFGVSPDSAHLGLAFEVETRDLAPYLERAFAEGPLLPAFAGAGPGIAISLELVDAWGRSLFRKGNAIDPAFGVEEKVADPRAGVFRGMTLRTSVPPSAADRLVLGGLPRSRLPILLAVLALAAGLLAAAIVLSRRERALALLRADFVSSVSHELRTPLAQIRLFAETLLLGRTRSPEERRRSLAIIDQEARRLTQLVENTLQFTRAERGTIALDLEDHDLGELVRDSIAACAPIAAARGARIVAEVPEGLFARVDAGALRQILLNLLDNAVKYGPAGQEVLVRLEPGTGVARILVEDRGPGIPERDRERIWEKFVRLDRDRQTNAAGAGIGLSVVRELASLHGGRVSVEDAPSGGARFTVSLPATRKEPTAQAGSGRIR